MERIHSTLWEVLLLSHHTKLFLDLFLEKVMLGDIIDAASIHVKSYYQDKHKLNGIKFAVQSMQIYDETERLKTDILWQMSWFLPKPRAN